MPDPDDAVARIRDAIESARGVGDTDAREAHVRTAVGEAVALRVQTDLSVADLQEQLTNVFAAPDEEAPYFLNQASDMLENLEEDIPQRCESLPEPPATGDEEPPESVQCIDGNLGVLELKFKLELTHPFIDSSNGGDEDDV